MRTRYLCFVKSIFLALFLSIFLLFFSVTARASDVLTSSLGASSVSTSSSGLPGSSSGYDFYRLVQAQEKKLPALPNNLNLSVSGTPSWKKVKAVYDARKKFSKNKNALRKHFLQYCKASLNHDWCPLWKQEKDAKFNNFQELKMSAGPPGWNARGTEAVTAFAVRIWREDPLDGKMDLIFDRSVEGDGQTGTNYRSGYFQRRASDYWWRAGGQGLYSTAGKRAGPIGANNGKTLPNCRHGGFNPAFGGSNEDINLKDAKKVKKVKITLLPKGVNLGEKAGKKFKRRGDCYWEGDDLVPQFRWGGNVANFIRSEGISGANLTFLNNNKDQFGGEKDWEINRGGVAGRGLKEAVRISWSIPESKGRAKIKTKILGAPGIVYAVQTVALGERNDIKGQKFSAYIPARAPRIPEKVCTVNCGDPKPTVQVIKRGDGQGIVKDIKDGGINCGIECDERSKEYEFNEKINLKIEPAADSEIKKAQNCRNYSLNTGTAACTIYTPPKSSKSPVIKVFVDFRLKEVPPPPPEPGPNWKGPQISFDLEHDTTTTVQQEEEVESVLSVDRSGDSGDIGQGDSVVGTDDDNSAEVLSDADLDASVQSDENPSADAFPLSRAFFHYTPQGKYSTENYEGYSIYKTPGDAPAQPLPAAGQSITKNPEKYEGKEKIMRIPAAEDISEGANDKLSSIDITWQQPTLENPCPLGSVYKKGGNWADDTRTGGVGSTGASGATGASAPAKCGDLNLFNSWDDLLMAEIQYDLVYQQGNQENAPIEYKTSPLRCNLNDIPTAGLPKVNRIEVKPGENCPANREWMPGNLPVAGRFAPAPLDEEFESPARIVLRSQGSFGQSISVTSGDEGSDEAITTSTPNPLTKEMEINLCNTGRPQDALPLALPEGDPDCLSPAVTWHWQQDNSPSTCQAGIPDFASYIEDEGAKSSTVGAPGSDQTGEEILDLMGGSWPEETLPYFGSLPRSGDEGALYRCAYRPQVQTINVYYLFEVRNRDYYVKAITRAQGSGAPTVSLPAGGTPWDKLESRKCNPEDINENNNITFNKLKNDAVNAEKYNCWYSKFVRSQDVPSDSSGWNNWNRKNNTKCDEDSDSRGFSSGSDSGKVCFWRSQRQNSPPPTGEGWQKDSQEDWRCWPDSSKENTVRGGMEDDHHTCYYKWTRQWHYGNNPPNWNYFGSGVNGYVNRGVWKLVPLARYSGLTGLRRYVGPGYVKNDGAAIGSIDSDLDSANGLIVSGKSGTSFINSGEVVPWRINASFYTYKDYPFVYERKESSAESYISVSATRLSG